MCPTSSGPTFSQRTQTSPVGENTVVNIGTDEETSVIEIARMVGGEVDHIIPNPRGEFEELRKSADISKTRSMIGWEPWIMASEGIRAVVAERQLLFEMRAPFRESALRPASLSYSSLKPD